jgi:hypothetical protein
MSCGQEASKKDSVKTDTSANHLPCHQQVQGYHQLPVSDIRHSTEMQKVTPRSSEIRIGQSRAVEVNRVDFELNRFLVVKRCYQF